MSDYARGCQRALDRYLALRREGYLREFAMHSSGLQDAIEGRPRPEPEAEPEPETDEPDALLSLPEPAPEPELAAENSELTVEYDEGPPLVDEEPVEVVDEAPADVGMSLESEWT